MFFLLRASSDEVSLVILAKSPIRLRLAEITTISRLARPVRIVLSFQLVAKLAVLCGIARIARLA
jgi:hypothetical protein